MKPYKRNEIWRLPVVSNMEPGTAVGLILVAVIGFNIVLSCLS